MLCVILLLLQHVFDNIIGLRLNRSLITSGNRAYFGSNKVQFMIFVDEKGRGSNSISIYIYRSIIIIIWYNLAILF